MQVSELTLSEVEEAKRQEWLAKRRKVVTSTDVAVLFDEGYSGTSPSLLYAQKLGLAPDLVPTEKMDWGLLLEDDIAEMYRRKTGIPVRLTDPYDLTYCVGNERFATTLDGYDAEGTLLEFKNTEEWVKDDEESSLWMGWRMQTQWQMMCAGVSKMKLVACVRGCRLAIVNTELSTDFIIAARQKATEFLNYIDTATPPPVSTPADNDAMKYLWTAEAGKSVIIEDVDIETVLDERDEIGVQMKELMQRKQLLEATAKDYLRDAEVGVLPDGGKVTWKPDKNGRRSLRRYKPRGS
jgi:predicted phage-related endonuclease